jgi:hypothetical protein
MLTKLSRLGSGISERIWDFSFLSGRGEIAALARLDNAAQIVQAEDDLEEWEAAERFLGRWQAVEADLQDAAAA